MNAGKKLSSHFLSLSLRARSSNGTIASSSISENMSVDSSTDVTGAVELPGWNGACNPPASQVVTYGKGVLALRHGIGPQRRGVLGVEFRGLRHASTPARSGPRFGRELAARPIDLSLAAILTRGRLRVVTTRRPGDARRAQAHHRIPCCTR